MKNNSVTAALLWALFVVAGLTVYFMLAYNMSFREVRQLQQKVLAFNNNRLIIQAIAVDLNEYSKRNPAIDPLLQSFSIKPGASNAPAASAPKSPAR